MSRSWFSKAGVVRFALVFGAAILCYFPGCRSGEPAGPAADGISGSISVEATGEEYLMSALDEVERITDITQAASHRTAFTVNSAAADTTYSHGVVTPDGYGAVVTERHTHPKGILLITVRTTYGRPPASVITTTRRYISFDDLFHDRPEQTTETEVFALSSDTIITRVLRNGVTETYTFRLPVISRVVNEVTGSVRVTRRYGDAGMVCSEVKDDLGNLISLRKSYGEPSGAVVTYTLYADSTWRNVRVLGRADGSIFRQTVSGQ